MRNFKSDFPIFNSIPDLVYLDSAATSQKPQMVLDAVNEFYTTYNSNIHRGLYPIAAKATQAVEKVRDMTQKFLHAKHREEIIFTKSATESVNLVAYAWGRQNLQKGDTVLTTITEHHANFVPWQQICQQVGGRFEVIDVDEAGELRIKNHESSIKNAKILAITYVSNVLGTINPIKEIIKHAREVNPTIIVLVDASQAAPHMQIDVQDLDCDFLVFTGHKMFAETGVGVLYGKKHLLEEMQPFLFGGEMIREVAIEKTTFAALPNKFEAGTLNIAGIISLGAAIDYIQSVGFAAMRKHERELIAYSLLRMEEIEGITIYGTKDVDKKAGILAFSLEGIHPHDIAEVLGQSNICVRAGHHCAMPLHTRFAIAASTRVSLHIYNSKEDIDFLVTELRRIKQFFSKKTTPLS